MSRRVLVVISTTETVRETVAHAVKRATSNGSGAVRLVSVLDRDGSNPADGEDDPAKLLDRAAVWAEADGETAGAELSVETGTIGVERPVAPGRLATRIAQHAETHDTDAVVLDAGLGESFTRRLVDQLTTRGVTIYESPSERSVRRSPLLAETTPLRLAVVFGLSFLFYLLLAGSLAPFDLVTGVFAASITAVGLSRVVFVAGPTRASPGRLLRGVLTAPYFLWALLKTNLMLAAVILNPRLPIDPRMTRIRPAVFGPFPTMVLANIISLTPGTLTVRLDGRDMIVHTLTEADRDDLFGGGLERAVRFVFYGRRGLAIDDLRSRGDTTVLGEAGVTSGDGTDGLDESDPSDPGGERS